MFILNLKNFYNKFILEKLIHLEIKIFTHETRLPYKYENDILNQKIL